MAMATFVQTFHNLTGKTLSDKLKNFNILLNSIPPDHDALIAALVPKTNFENLLKLKLLLKLQRSPELLQILKSDEEYLPAKLLKSRWFCQQLAKMLDENSEGFVENLLPYTSYLIRRRIIAKLATFGTNLDGVFDEIRTRYGIHIAAPLLVACRSEKIADIYRNDETVVLAPLYQKLLYRKHPQLFIQYLKNNSGNVDASVISYVAKCNIDDFLALVKELDYFNADLGKRLTRKILTNHREYIIENSRNYSCVLHLKTVIKGLSETQFKTFLSNCYPPDFTNLAYCGHIGFNSLCKKLGSNYYRFLLEIVSEKYKKSLDDYPDLVTEEMMRCMATEERLRWVSIKTKSGDNDFVTFMKTSDSIPLIKDKINVTSSIYGRSELVKQLVKTCEINKDVDALAGVCEYVATRHRNDDDVLTEFVYQLKSSFQLEKLDERHWKSINLIVTQQNSQGYYVGDFRLKNVEFLFSSKKLTEDAIRNLFKSVNGVPECPEELRKLLLVKKIDFVPVLLQQDQKLEYEDLTVICMILDWNQSHPTAKIAIFEYPRLVSSLEKCLTIAQESDSYIQELTGLESVFKSFICTKEKSNFRDVMIMKYFLIPCRFQSVEIDFWLLKNEPDVIYNNFDKFVEHTFDSHNPDIILLNYIKMYTDSIFQNRVINYCLGIVAEKGNKMVFQTLAMLESPENFLQLIGPFYPSSNKMGDSEEAQKNGGIAIAIAESFKYASSTLLLPALVTYCKGDYLRHSLESLYYRFYHSPENRLSVFINDLSSKAVSVRKHSIFLTCTVGSVPDVEKLLKRFAETEKNVSVLKHLCMATLRYFIKNPNDEFWEYLKICMTKLDKNDTESFNMLVNLHRIPTKYQSRHVIFVWEILKKSQDKHRPRLLSSIPRGLFSDFPLDFLLEVISGNLFKPGASCETTINDFIVSCLIQSVHKSEVANTVFQIMRQVDVAKTQSLEKEKASKDMLSDFVGSIVNGLTTGNDCDTLRAFSIEWHALFPPIEAIREHLKLSLALLYLESGKDLVKFRTPLVHFFENFVSTYTLALVDCFASELVNSFKLFLCRYGDMGEDFYKLCLQLSKFDNLAIKLLVVKMLPGKQPSSEDSKKLHFEIVDSVRNVQDISIRVLMNLYVSDLE